MSFSLRRIDGLVHREKENNVGRTESSVLFVGRTLVFTSDDKWVGESKGGATVPRFVFLLCTLSCLGLPLSRILD